MKKRVLWIKRGWGVLLFIFVIIPQGCESAKRYTGTYVSVSEGQLPQSESILELKEGGNAVWTTDEKEVPFRWSVKMKEIRLHTKEGGVVIGEIINDTIKIPLPTCYMPKKEGICLPRYKVVSFKKRRAY
jgi:hypothetical protein